MQRFISRVSARFYCANFCKSLPEQFTKFEWWRYYEEKYASPAWKLYANLPAGQSTKRGHIIKKAVREEYERIVGLTLDPVKDPSKASASYDFLDITNNRKIEVKSSVVQFLKRRNQYYLTFQKVRPSESDTILLVGYFPDCLRVWEWDGFSCLHKNGYKTKVLGYTVDTTTKKNESWNVLKDVNLGKVFSNMQVETLIPFCKLTEREKLYDGAPFSIFTSTALGFVTEDIAKAVYESQVGTVSLSSSSSYDFHDISHDKRVEVKSSSISYSKSAKHFFYFKNIKATMFDILLLVFYFPDRFEIWKWDKSTSGELSRGNRGDIDGQTLWFLCQDDFSLNKCPGELLAKSSFHVK